MQDCLLMGCTKVDRLDFRAISAGEVFREIDVYEALIHWHVPLQLPAVGILFLYVEKMFSESVKKGMKHFSKICLSCVDVFFHSDLHSFFILLFFVYLWLSIADRQLLLLV